MEETNTKKKNSRPRGRHIKVWVTREEYEEIASMAKQVGLSHSSYLRSLGLRQQLKSIVDLQAVQKLAKVNSELGRVAGLLKLWLAEKKGQGADSNTVENMMRDFRVLQRNMTNLMGEILKNR